MNGAIARTNNGVVYNRMIPYKTARPILMACDQYGLKTVSETSGMHYSNFNVSGVCKNNDDDGVAEWIIDNVL